MTMRHKPTCRYCGTKVPSFGDICALCVDGAEAIEGLRQIIAVDLVRLMEAVEGT